MNQIEIDKFSCTYYYNSNYCNRQSTVQHNRHLFATYFFINNNAN